jgi:hypothetical protein
LSAELSEAPCTEGAGTRASLTFSLLASDADTVSILVNASSFSVQVTLLADGEAIASETDCPSVPTAEACLLEVPLASGGPYLLEVGSAETPTTGTFQLVAWPPRSPAPPPGLAQSEVATGDPVPPGGTIRQTSIRLAAGLSDPDEWDPVAFEVELRETSEPFVGAPTHSASLAPQGARDILVDALLPGRRYHWQARGVDATGRSGPWVAYGKAGRADFQVVTEPLPPAELRQLRADGSTMIAPGGSSDGSTVVLTGVPAHATPGTTVTLEVEVTGNGLLGGSTRRGFSTPTEAGTVASVTLSGLVRGSTYEWRARTVDEFGAVTGWIDFATGAGPDFFVPLL